MKNDSVRKKLRKRVRNETTIAALAKFMDWPYQRLNQKLGGFAVLNNDEATEIETALDKMKK